MLPLIVFALSAAICLYTIVGYPLLLGLLARWKGRAVRKAPYQPAVSIILPNYNGEKWIGPKLESILALNYPSHLVEILIADDGSTDASCAIVERFLSRGNIRLTRLDRGGKATALNVLMARATGEILFFTDVRQTLSRDSLSNLAACFSDPEVGVASGELIITDGAGAEEAGVGLYWKYEKFIRKNQSRLDSVPGATGCIYAMRRSLARTLPANTLCDDMYLPLGAFLEGYRVVLDDSAQAYDLPSQLAGEFRRKVRTLAGVYQIVGRYPALLGPGNRMWFHFLSHKLARLLMPWALLAAAVSTVFLPTPWREWAAAAQIACYGLALIDYVLPERSFLKRLSSPARTFVVLMAASLCAVCVLFVPARLLWKETRIGRTAAAK